MWGPMTISAKTVRLFLADGSPTGIRTAEIMNWTGHVVVAPRSKLPEALKRPEASRTGVYFLTGDDPNQPSKQRVYIGEGDNVIDRIKNHAKDVSKDFWTHVCIVTSKDANLTKAHVRYLESRLVELAKRADRAVIANGNEPGAKQLPESDIADMEFFLLQMQVVLPVVGLDFIRPKPSANPIGLFSSDDPVPQPSQIHLILSNKKHGIEATAVENDGEVTVLCGSRAIAKTEFASNQYASLRQGLIDSGILVLSADKNGLIFTADTTFKSPSAAAAVILNRNSNGRVEWRIKQNGQTLKEWQDSQLAAIVSDTEQTSGPVSPSPSAI
jgi:hypothetical protein